MRWSVWLWLALPALGTELGAQDARADGTSGKKVIEMRATAPDASFMQAHVREMDERGFDGLVYEPTGVVNGRVVYLGRTWWGSRRFEYADFARNAEIVATCGFKKLTDNFLRLNVCPGDVAWHDASAFAVVTHNASLAARFARESGAKGFMLDVEQYETPLFRFDAERLGTSKTFAEYEAIVRQRGRELIRAINEQYPNITILMTYGYEITGGNGGRASSPYGLLKSFLDGLFEAAHSRTTLVHAYERSYGFRAQREYKQAYQAIHHELAALSAVPELYRQRVQAGFGIWLDMGRQRYGWHARDFRRNYFTPQEFAYALAAALGVSDRYVWVYTQVPQWWPPGPNWPIARPVPDPYVRALRRGKAKPLIGGDRRIPSHIIVGDQLRAQFVPGFDDEHTFAEFWEQWTLRADLPDRWSFKPDPGQRGVAQRWFDPQRSPDETWQEFEIARFWDEQRKPYVGDAWYRVDWVPPHLALQADEELALLFGAVDESARVWINGVFAGEHDVGASGWNHAFPIDVTGKLRPGGTNTIAVLVRNTEGAGGIWKNVKLASRIRPDTR